MSRPELIDRKEIALILSISCRAVANNEVRLGIRAAKVRINGRLIRYKRKMALANLARNGFLESAKKE